jgi:uncharacterized protein
VILAVIDTNVLVSALISPSGNEALLLLAIKQRLLRPCFSRDVLSEYSQVLARPKFSFPRDQIEALIQLLRGNGDLVSPRTVSGVPPDPKDDKFICLCHSGARGFHSNGQQERFSR